MNFSLGRYRRNLRTKSKFYLFSGNKIASFLGKYIDKRLEMIFQLIFNGFSSIFEGMNDILNTSLEKENKMASMQNQHFLKNFQGSANHNLSINDHFTQSEIKVMDEMNLSENVSLLKNVNNQN